MTVPSSVPNADTGTRTTMDTSPSALSAVLSAEAPISSFPLSSLASTSSPPLSTGILARQATSTPSSSLETPSAQTSQTTASPTNSAETSLGQTLPSISILPNTSNEPLVSIGPYVCTTSITLSTFITQLLDYIQKTQNTIGAHLLYVDLNIHAAANSSSPTSPAPKPSGLPQPQDLLGSLFEANLSAYMYTPSNLMSERANINGSWYTVPEIHRPAQAFYITETNEYGIASTDDGWPSEGYIEFSKSKRLLLGFGTVDPQMSGYNFTGDDSTIFPRGYILDNQLDVDATDSGRVTNGCFLHNNTEDLSRVNSSWAIATTLSNFDYPTSPSADILPLLNLTTNLTNCGISPVLNVTLLNSTAHDNFVPYQNYSYATIWSWAPGEPKNASSGDGSDSLFRCASANVDLAGRWVVNDCSNKYYASCRAVNQPYNWTITSYPISYSYANQACPEGYNFAAPRTSLENSYLLQAMILSHRDFDGHGAWVDFNSLDTKGCWVSGGPNATCPYTESLGDHDYLYRKYVLVRPTPILTLRCQ